MSSTTELQSRPLKRGESVRLVEEIPGHPAGSSGKVAVANGISWIRYWIRFSDGSSVGHIDHSKLVRAKDYDKFIRSSELEAQAAAREAESHQMEADGDDSSEPNDSSHTASNVVGGVAIPQALLNRSKTARTRLGG